MKAIHVAMVLAVAALAPTVSHAQDAPDSVRSQMAAAAVRALHAEGSPAAVGDIVVALPTAASAGLRTDADFGPFVAAATNRKHAMVAVVLTREASRPVRGVFFDADLKPMEWAEVTKADLAQKKQTAVSDALKPITTVSASAWKAELTGEKVLADDGTPVTAFRIVSLKDAPVVVPSPRP